MSKRLIWNLLFVSLSFLLAFAAKEAFFKYFHYSKLTHETKAHVTSWKVETKGSYFFLQASYDFFCNGSLYTGATTFSTPLYLNSWAAETAEKELSKKEWTVFYNSKNKQINSLERVFPTKEFIHLILVAGLGIYFVILKKILQRKVN